MKFLGKPMNGLLVLDKPSGPTSRQIVDQVQRYLPRRTKVGHAGTLDPLATGVLVVCIGTATRLVELVQDLGKTYHSRFRLDGISSTDDADGIIQPLVSAAASESAAASASADVRIPDESAVRSALSEWVGFVEQVPPDYSAAHVAGQRAYKLARKGEVVELSARLVRIDAIELRHYAWPTLEVEIDCGKGTYIRALARDVGRRLGVGGYVETLRRTRIGPFRVEDALPSSELRSRAILEAHLLPLVSAVPELPQVMLPPKYLRQLTFGQWIPASVWRSALGTAWGTAKDSGAAPGANFRSHPSGDSDESFASSAKRWAVVTVTGELAALAEVRDDGALGPDKVFVRPEECDAV